MRINVEERLQKEREKLNRMVEMALAQNTVIEQARAIIDQCEKIRRIEAQNAKAVLRNKQIQKQSRKVDALIAKREELIR